MQLNDKVTIDKTQDGNYLVFDEDTKQYYRFGEQEGLFLKQYDPENRDEVSLDWNETTRREAETLFLEMGLLVDETVPVKAKKKRSLNVIRIKLFECSINRFLDRISGFIQAVTGAKAVALYAVLIAAGMIAVPINAKYIGERLGTMIGGGENGFLSIAFQDLLLAYLLVLLAICVHEFAHIFMCRRYCGKVGKLGVMLYFMQPALYSDLSHLHGITNKKQKAKAMFAGVFTQFVLSGAAVLLAIMLHAVFSVHADFLILFAMINIVIGLYNLNPFMKLDGYWILSTLLDMRNLYDKSMAFTFGKLTRSKINLGLEKENKAVLTLYGLSASVFFVLFWGYILTTMYQSIESFTNDHPASMIVTFLGVLLLLQLLFSFSSSFRRRKVLQG